MSINSMVRELVGRKLVRNGFAAAAITLSGCALDPQGGYRPVTQISGSPERPISFNEANTQCRTASMNIAGYGATTPQLEAYRMCMARNGWEDRRRLF
jgi:hypothetical protein